MSIPNQVAEVPFLAGYDNTDDPVSMERPPSDATGVLTWNGSGWVFASGGSGDPIPLGGVPTTDAPFVGGIMARKENGDLVEIKKAADNATYAVKFVDGVLTLVNEIFNSVQNPYNAIVSGIEGVTAYLATTSKVQFSAKTLIFINAAGDYITLRDVTDKYADLAVSGKNGRDTGAIAQNTWYHYYAIYNPTTEEIAGVLSQSDTAPTLSGISGFTYWAYVGTCISTPTVTQFVPFRQSGRSFVREEYTFTNAFAITAAGSEADLFVAFTSTGNPERAYPPSAKTISGNVGGRGTVAGPNIVELASTTEGLGKIMVHGAGSATINTSMTPYRVWVGSFSNLMLDPSMFVYIRVHQSGTNLAGAGQLQIGVTGFTI